MSDIVFLIDRNIYYKFMAPIIEETIKYNLNITLLHISHGSSLSKNDDKLFYYPQMNQIPQFNKTVQNYAMVEDIPEIIEYLKKNKTKLVFSLHPKNRYNINLPNLKWVTVQHGIDSTKYAHQDTDYYICYTKQWLEGNSISNSCKIFEAGLFYSNSHLVGNRNAICRKYNLDPDKKYYLFLPLPSDSSRNYTFFPNKFYSHYHLKRLQRIELKILDSMLESLKGMNTEIILKSRFKRLLPPIYKKYGRIFYDETFYPNTISELCSIASHCYINFMPTATTIELASFNTPLTFIHYPEYEKYVFSHITEKMKNIFLPKNPTNWVRHTDLDNLLKHNQSNQNFDQDYITHYIRRPNHPKIDAIINIILKENFNNA